MTETILILGWDGYTGYPITKHLLSHGHNIVGIDNHLRRINAHPSVTPLDSPPERKHYCNNAFDGRLEIIEGDITNHNTIKNALQTFTPGTVINLAQIPSAPYSMHSQETAKRTIQNNQIGSLNLFWALRNHDQLDTHVIQLATMGEYPAGRDIPEGFLADGRPAPKDPDSFYHASKVHTTVNTYLASKLWDIPVTEVYQGIIYGVGPWEFWTRFDVDPTWGTVLNRFTAQGVLGEDVTVYGKGGQKRAVLPLDECVRCIKLLVDNPPESGGYRAVNQFTEAYRVRELAELFSDVFDVGIRYIENPRRRVEDDGDHAYGPDRVVLDDLGYGPEVELRDVIARTGSVVGEFDGRLGSASSVDAVWD